MCSGAGSCKSSASDIAWCSVKQRGALGSLSILAHLEADVAPAERAVQKHCTPLPHRPQQLRQAAESTISSYGSQQEAQSAAAAGGRKHSQRLREHFAGAVGVTVTGHAVRNPQPSRVPHPPQTLCTPVPSLAQPPGRHALHTTA